MISWHLMLAADLWVRPAHQDKPFDADLARDIGQLLQAVYLVGREDGRQAKTRAAILTLKEFRT